MSFNLLSFSQSFYKLATDIDVEQRLRMFDSWNNVTDESTARIFFQELKSKPGEHKDKVRATKLLYEIKKILIDLRGELLYIINSLKDLHRPFIFDPYSIIYDDFYRKVNEFIPLIKKFGEANSFQDEHLQKLFRVIKIVLWIYNAWKNGQKIPLKLYAEFLYIDEERILQDYCFAIQEIINKYDKNIKRVQEKSFTDYKNLYVFLVKFKKTKSLFSDENEDESIDDSLGSIEDFLVAEDNYKDAVEDNDTFKDALVAIFNFLKKRLNVLEFEIAAMSNWVTFRSSLHQLYLIKDFEKKAQLEKVLKELKSTRSFSDEMQTVINDCSF